MVIFIIFGVILGVGLNAEAKISNALSSSIDNFKKVGSLIRGEKDNKIKNDSGNLLSKILNIQNNAAIFKFLSFDSNLGGSIDDNQDDGALLQNEEVNILNQKIIYEVKEGDTLIGIAQNFGVNVNTILWANKIRDPRLIRPGDQLVILPIDGVVYTVKQGDTLLSIAKRFRGDIDRIIEFNNLSLDGILMPGQEIIIPDGELPLPLPPARKSSVPQSQINREYPSKVQIDDSYFIMPTTGRNWGKKHANNGVDISNSCGTPVWAAADGEVIYVSFTPSTWRYANGGYGNNIRILHPNGTITLYGHLLYGSEQVKIGDIVNKSQLIAYMGGSPGMAGAGNSTGCHVHFEVRGGRNPFVWR